MFEVGSIHKIFNVESHVIFLISERVAFLYFGIIKNKNFGSTFCIAIAMLEFLFTFGKCFENHLESLSVIRGGENVTTCAFSVFAKETILFTLLSSILLEGAVIPSTGTQ